MPGHQRKCPETSSENERGEVHCRHVPSCTKWVPRRTRNRHWKDLPDASDADDEDSSSEAEEPAVELSDEGSSSDEAEEPAVELSDEGSSSDEAEECEPAVELYDEGSSSSLSAVELSDEGSSSSEEQQPLATSQRPPLDFPASPAPHEAVSDNGFNMDGYDQQSDNISGWYTTEEEVRSSPFNVLD